MLEQELDITILVVSSILAVFIILIVMFIAIVNYHRKLLKNKETIFAQIIDATEIETQRIGQNLHDDLGPLLASVKLTISGTLYGAQLEDKYHDLLFDGKTYITQAINTVRDQSHNLNAANFDKQSFYEILQGRIDSLNLSDEWNGEIIGYNFDWKFQHTSKLMLFRICNELIYNTIKHSEGSEFHLDFKENESEIQLIYEDNGTKEITPSEISGIGMNGIGSRVKYLNGLMTLASQRGFKVLFAFPKTSLLI